MHGAPPPPVIRPPNAAADHQFVGAQLYCVPLSSQTPPSAERNLLHVTDSTRTVYGRQPFAIAGPSTWNSLPDPVRNPNATEAAFRRLLKSFLFAWYRRTQHNIVGSPVMRYTK